MGDTTMTSTGMGGTAGTVSSFSDSTTLAAVNATLQSEFGEEGEEWEDGAESIIVEAMSGLGIDIEELAESPSHPSKAPGVEELSRIPEQAIAEEITPAATADAAEVGQ